MNIKFNGANPCTPKNLAKQLIVESAKILNHQQRQALIDIFKALDQAEKSTLENIESLQKYEPKPKKHSENFVYQDEFNQEYWSGHYCDSYAQQDFPEDWVKRTQQRPRHHFSNTTY